MRFRRRRRMLDRCDSQQPRTMAAASLAPPRALAWAIVGCLVSTVLLAQGGTAAAARWTFQQRSTPVVSGADTFAGASTAAHWAHQQTPKVTEPGDSALFGVSCRSRVWCMAVGGPETIGMPFLFWRDRTGTQRIFSLGARVRATIGRRASNDIVLGDDEEASRTHAEFARVGEEWTVTDDGLSRNGIDAVKNHLRLVFQRFEIAGLPQNQKRARLVECAFQWGLVSERDPVGRRCQVGASASMRPV